MTSKEKKEVFMYALGAIVVIGFFVILGILVYEKTYEGTINLAIGALIGAFATVVGYFYGSSKGSSDKNEILKQTK
jgi:uncharacterized membrane protein